MLKKWFLSLSILYSVVLIAICLIKTDGLPRVGLPYIDKIFHFFTYAVLTLLWFRTFFYTFIIEKKKAQIYAVLFSILFGIIIEVLQEILTTSRSADVYDIVANTLGVLLAVLMIAINNRINIKNQ